VSGLAVCAVAGALFRSLHAPLPWLIGPLIAMAACRFAGLRLTAPMPAARIAQWCIGTTLGLYFTPSVAAIVVSRWPVLIAAASFSLVLAFVCGLWLARYTGMDRTTAFLASVPGGAQEMANIGERYGGKVDRIAIAQSLRILLVVIIIPFSLTFSGVHGADAFEGVHAAVALPQLALLMLCTGAGGLALHVLRLPNAWMLGPLFVSIVLTAHGVAWSSMPGPMANAAQVLIGCNLGQRYEREFLRAAPRFVTMVCTSVMIGMVVSALFALVLGWAADIAAPTMVLATAPGGIAEMSLTARTLRLGVAIVVAAHVSRVVILVTATAPIFRLARWFVRRRDLRTGASPD